MRDAVHLGDDRDRVRVPFRQPVAARHLRPVIGQQPCAVRHAVARLLAAGLVEQQHLGVAAHHDRTAGRVDDDVAVLDLDLAVERRLDRGLLGAALRRAADMEGAHRQLRAGLADRLRRDDADRFAHIDDGAARQIAPIALAAHADLQLAGQHRADRHRVDAGPLDRVDRVLVDQPAGGEHDLARQRVEHVDRGAAPENAVGQRRDDVAALDDGAGQQAAGRAAILLGDDRVLRDIDEAAGQIAGIGGLQRRVGETLAGAVRRVEVFEDGQTLLEVRDDRGGDDLARGLGHQPAHPGQLLDLRRRAARAGVRHHPHRVDRLAGFDLADDLHHLLGDLVRARGPGVDFLVVLLALRDQPVLVLLLVLLDLLLHLGDETVLGLGDDQIVLAERDAGLARLLEPEAHQPVAEDHGLLLAAEAVDVIDQVADLLLAEHLVDQLEIDRRVARQDLRQQHAARRRLDAPDDRAALLIDGAEARLDPGVQRHRLRGERLLDLADIGEGHALAGLAVALHRDVVEAEHDVLRRHDDRLAVGRRQDVVGRHHQDARLELRLQRQRHVHRHLVAVEIGVERGADQRVQLDRLALDQHRLEGLDAEAVQRRGAVQQDRVLADHLFEDVPHLGPFLLDHALGGLDRARQTVEFELRVDERLEQFERHLLRQPALVQLQFRTDDDHRAAGIIDALAEQVLAEAALLALQHVGQRLQRPLVGAGDDAAAPAVVEQRVDRLLQHALLVAHDDVGRAQLDQALQPVVAVDDAAVQIVEVRGREAAAIQRHQRAQFGRDHRHDFEDHPFRPAVQFDERLDQLQPLDELLAPRLGIGVAQLVAQPLFLLDAVDRRQHRAQRLGADRGGELVVAVFVLRLQAALPRSSSWRNFSGVRPGSMTT